MKKILFILPRWLPALALMIIIFMFSSQPGDELPDFLDWDYLVKKAGHVIGYGMLALSYLHFLKNYKGKYWLAWGLAFLYAASDEFHQTFVPGRSATVTDVLIFDNLGAIIALSFHFKYLAKRKDAIHQA